MRYKDTEWDFRTADTKEYTHCFHNYPAMMIPQISRTLLSQYGLENGWLLDPYCGTGTSLVEASLFGMNSVGCDINSLARLIATAKTTVVPLQALDHHLEDLNNYIFKTEFTGNTPEVSIPDVLNLEYWFSKEVMKLLLFLREYIISVKNDAIRNFFWVAFSETVRECSYTRNSEFKLYRMPAQKLEDFTPDVLGIFHTKLIRNQRGLEYYLEKRKRVEVIISDSNTAEGEILKQRPIQGFDLVITSPPYGDSQTTVAYGQFSRLSAEWIGLSNARKIDRLSMGGRRQCRELNLSPVTKAIEKIRLIDEKRASQVEAFYIDLENSINAVAALLAKHSTACYVVGNRRVKGVTLPTDEFIAFMFDKYGFSHKETIVRNIPNKRMPAKNSPSNIVGKTDITMHEENIVICQI